MSGCDGVSEVVCVREGEMVGMGIRRDEEVEEDGGYARALGYARSGEAFGGCCVVEAAASNAPPEVRGEPPHGVVVELGCI